jgi:cation diffusion facilitator family transporter
MNTSQQQVNRVLWITLILNMVVAVGKISLGVLTGVLAIAADGFHSLADSAGNIAGLIANYYAGQPPDDEHPYGHRRFETLAALLIGGLLLLTAWEVGRGALERLQTQEHPDVSPLGIGVLVVTLVINVFVSRYQIASGRRLRSEILLADAQNTSSDVWVTVSVLTSTILMQLTGWWWLDVVAALGVTVMIGRAAIGILRQTSRVLVDAAPYSPEEIKEALGDVEGVQSLGRARSRGTPDAAHIDLEIHIAPQMNAAQIRAIIERVRQRLQERLDGHLDIDIEPLMGTHEATDPAMIVRVTADLYGLTTHEVQRHGPELELHVEVPPGQTLAAAHTQVSAFEAAVQDALPDIDRITTHIEPSVSLEERSDLHLPDRLASVADAIMLLLQKHYPHIGWHDLRLRPSVSGFAMAVHATLPPQITVEAAHYIAESAETMLRGQWRQLQRVTIHTEPFDHEGDKDV